MNQPTRLVVVSGGTSDPSSTRMLADRITARVLERATDRGLEVTRLRHRAAAARRGARLRAGHRLRPARRRGRVATLAEADALIVATPVYKAGVSGLVKSFFDVVDQDLLIAVPTVLAATAGTSRHALVADEQLRSLLAYLRALSDADERLRRERGLGHARRSPTASTARRTSSSCSSPPT